MTYRIARSGQTFGPYTEGEIRQYLVSGNIGLTDMVQREGTVVWVPVLEMFPLATAAAAPISVPGVKPVALFPDPPDFPWWAALLLGVVTGGVFFVVWDIVEASWLKRIERNSTALLFYIGVAILYLFKLPSVWSTVNFNVFGGPSLHPHGGSLESIGFVLAIVARFVFRRELLTHFQQHERVELQLNGLLTLIFGGLYFQYKFNEINATKRLANTGVNVV